jgi:hypothetical protein
MAASRSDAGVRRYPACERQNSSKSIAKLDRVSRPYCIAAHELFAAELSLQLGQFTHHLVLIPNLKCFAIEHRPQV